MVIEQLLSLQRTSDDPWLVGALHGTCGNAEHPYIIELRGVFQRCEGPVTPPVESIARWLDNQHRTLHGPPSASIESTVAIEPDHVTFEPIGDWHV